MVGFGRGYLLTRGAFVRDQPAGHRNLQDPDQMMALSQVALQCYRIITWIECTRGRNDARHTDDLEVVAGMVFHGGPPSLGLGDGKGASRLTHQCEAMYFP